MLSKNTRLTMHHHQKLAVIREGGDEKVKLIVIQEIYRKQNTVFKCSTQTHFLVSGKYQLYHCNKPSVAV